MISERIKYTVTAATQKTYGSVGSLDPIAGLLDGMSGLIDSLNIRAEFETFEDALRQALNAFNAQEHKVECFIIWQGSRAVGTVLYREDGRLVVSRTDQPMYAVVTTTSGALKVHGSFMNPDTSQAFNDRKLQGLGAVKVINLPE